MVFVRKTNFLRKEMVLCRKTNFFRRQNGFGQENRFFCPEKTKQNIQKSVQKDSFFVFRAKKLVVLSKTIFS